MSNADTTNIDRAEEADMSLAAVTATRGHVQRGVGPSYSTSAQHIPGDTTTPPAPGAIAIGPVDC